MENRLTVQQGLALLSKAHKDHVVVFNHGSLDVEYYQPARIDRQTPHIRDEIYVVIAGSGFFVKGGERQPFEAGEVIFVPAYVEHHFEEFTDDFATWVFFFGPEGGEVA